MPQGVIGLARHVLVLVLVFGIGSTLALAVIRPAWAAPPASSRHVAALAGSNVVRAADLVRDIAVGKAIELADAKISGDLDLRPVGTVSQPVRCVSCDFEGAVIASDVIFRRIVLLSGARIVGPIDFRGAEFDGGFFLRPSDRPAIAENRSSFALATFGDGASFDRTRFMGPTDFGGTRFVRDVSFSETDFDDEAVFDQAVFEGNAIFSSDVQTSPATVGLDQTDSCRSLVLGAFGDTAGFSRAVFHGTSDFRQRCFVGDASFQNATFEGKADFSRAIFQQAAAFGSVGFASGASFVVTRFQGNASFLEVAAARSMDFEGATFAAQSSFFGTTVSGSFSLEGAIFGRTVDMSKIIADDFTMGVEAVSQVGGSTSRKHVLRLIETSAEKRGDLALSNDARFHLLALEHGDLRGVPQLVDGLLYRDVAGYLVRPNYPLLVFLWLLVLGTIVRGILRIRRHGRTPPPTPWPVAVASSAGARGVGRAPAAALSVAKVSSAFVEGFGDTLSVAFRPKPTIEVTDREDPRAYAIAALQWTEYLAFKVLIALFLLALANSNATLRELIDSIRG